MATSDLDIVGRTPTPQQAAARAKLEKLIAESGVKPLTIEELNAMGDLWPEDESVDDFLEWREQLRKEACNIEVGSVSEVGSRVRI